ncbi:MAG: glycosyltransferase [Proteobacteria bacterium]|nr:glycosyltransferase [Pseudomonadota bacterium]
MPASKPPVFSLVWYGKNRVDSARETVAALKEQAFGDFEVLVEDCGSSDGTVEVFREAAERDPRIRVYARGWQKRADALLSATRRARGEFILFCPSEGVFMATALEKIAAAFAEHPRTGAIATSGTLVNKDGESLERCDIVTLLFTSYSLNLPAVAFRRTALNEVGLHEDRWFSNSLGLDLVCRVATSRGLFCLGEAILTQPRRILQVDGLEYPVSAIIADRLALVAELFSARGFFAPAWDALAWEARVNQTVAVIEQYTAVGGGALELEGFQAMLKVADGIHQQLKYDHRTLRSLHRLFCCRSHNLGYLEAPLQKSLAGMAQLDMGEQIRRGYRIWTFPVGGPWLVRKFIARTSPKVAFHPEAPSWESMYADLYRLAGARYEARGQIDIALEMWDRARPPADPDLDSMACQAMLKSPYATDEALAARHVDWVRDHAPGSKPIAPRRVPRPNGKIRIGYHCSFLDSDTMRNMMREVIAAHDRTRFEVYGYGPQQVPPDLAVHLDAQRHTPQANVSDKAFADLLKADEIDVFMELSGYSPGHRFGAMALRGAPVQISFLNHTGTSMVPNVDYVIADEICLPTGSPAEQFYSEKVWRLPDCFFCFDYTKFDEPFTPEPPFLKNGFITFGCFGTGGKIGRELVAIWADLLRRVPNSKLYLQNPQLSLEVDRTFLRDCFKMVGVSPDRLIIEPGVERRQLIRNYGLVDISLDTWPYAGGNTIAESLWHGVPVVTYRGDRFSSTYGASLLAAAGCPELVGNSPEEYVAVAAKLAAEPDKLVYLRTNLRRMSVEHGLGDSKRFARRLEEAFTRMLEEVPVA